MSHLLKDLAITRPDQVRCTDIGCIPMRRGFLYLVAVIDRHSQKVPGWRLSNSMAVGFRIDASQEALARYGPPGIFNSDRGSQFTGADFASDSSRRAARRIGEDLDGRAWPLARFPSFASKRLPGDGQPDDRTALAIAETRMRRSERLRDRLAGPQRDRRADPLPHRKTPALSASSADASRGP